MKNAHTSELGRTRRPPSLFIRVTPRRNPFQQHEIKNVISYFCLSARAFNKISRAACMRLGRAGHGAFEADHIAFGRAIAPILYDKSSQMYGLYLLHLRRGSLPPCVMVYENSNRRRVYVCEQIDLKNRGMHVVRADIR